MLTAARVKELARHAGFDLCGIAPAVTLPKLARLAEWIADGYAGEMTYLADSLDERLNPQQSLPTAQSVISLAVVYNTDQPYSATVADAACVSVARYAWGSDYHDVMRQRLRALLTALAAEAGPGFEALTCVDHEPIQERVFAEAAGIGWIAKNTCVINPQLGSWLFLGEIITNAALEPDTPLPDQCGTCTRCIEACPTEAIVTSPTAADSGPAPYTVDATRCLSYLTIETRGAVPEAMRGALSTQVFGCDICQDVCPWNRKAAVSEAPEWQPRPRLRAPRLVELCEMSDDAWSAEIKGSAMRRAGLHRIRRTLAYAIGARSLAGATAHDAHACLQALERHPSAAAPVVAAALAWARQSIG
ncbi:MAG: tRNA epoxyqueuosine(34) reductase QueG [Acidobacteria bacterium]|nr:tRNA epoxyqueuosine(34) reductase QueG [Acidobacteriota bacterium]